MKKYFYILIVNLVCFSSCKNEEKVRQEKSKIELTKDYSISYKIDFPDTVYINETYKGVVYYKSILDTVTTSFNDKEKERYTILYLKLASNYIYEDFNYEDFKRTAKLKYGADDNSKITFNKIKFDSLGVYYINGVIKDFVYIDLHKKDKNGVDLLRLIEKEQEFLHKVVVVNRPMPKKSRG